MASKRSSIISLPIFFALTTLPALDQLCGAQPEITGTFDVVSYGASGDGTTKNTQSIQKAIDDAAARGRGTVIFPPGRYLTGTLLLKSGVTLYLTKGAILLGSTDLADFPVIPSAIRSYTDNYVNRSLIFGEDLTDVAIVGQGTIDGQGAEYRDVSYLIRPYLIRFVKCRNILVDGINLLNSPMWVQHYLACDYVKLRGLTVQSQANRNNDMLDIDGCHNVVISDCVADTEDDCITLKSSLNRTTENVAVTNCVLSSQCNAIKLGTESNGGFRNIVISNCVIDSSYEEKYGYLDRKRGQSGISLLLVDGGTLQNVVISNISMSHVTVPIFMRLGDRGRPFEKSRSRPAVGSFRDVVLSNITAQNSGVPGCAIAGLSGNPIKNVTLSNIKISFPGGGTLEDAVRSIPELREEYPRSNMFGSLPAWGLYCRHVEELKLNQIDLRVESEDERPMMHFEDVSRLTLGGVTESRISASEAPMIVMRDVSNALLSTCSPSVFTKFFLRLEGRTRDVTVFGNQLMGIESPFQFGTGVSHHVLVDLGNGLRH